MEMRADSRQNPRKYVYIVTVFLVLLLGIEIIIGKDVCKSWNAASEVITSDTLADIVRYNVDGNNFYLVEEDPQLYIHSTLAKQQKMTINFASPLEADTPFQVFLIQNDKYLTVNAGSPDLEAGCMSKEVTFRSDAYDRLRIDIDGNFSIESVVIDGESGSFSAKKLICYVILCILINAGCVYTAFKNKYCRRIMDFLEKERCDFLKSKNKLKYLCHIFCRMSTAIYQFGAGKHWNIQKSFVLLAVLSGVTYSVIIPVGQVPDEYTHLRMMEEEFGTTGYAVFVEETFYQEMDLYSIQRAPDQKIDKDAYKEAAKIRFDSSLDLQLTSFHPSVTVIRHLPAGIGFYLGVALHLPVLWCLHLAEWFAILFYVVMGWYALRYMPVCKELLCMSMLLPMCVQQYASFNYDAVLFPICFVLIAYILHLRFEKEKVTWFDVVAVLFMMGCLALIKIPYVVIGAMVLIIPLDKMDLPIGKKIKVQVIVKRYRIPLLLLVLGGGFAGIYILRNSANIKIFVAAFLEFPRTCVLFINTLKEWTPLYIRSFFGGFGWLDCFISAKYMVVIAAMLLLMLCTGQGKSEDKQSHVLKLYEKTVILLCMTAIVMLIFIAMISWSVTLAELDANVNLAVYRTYLYKVTQMLGVQGRYFLPIAIMALLPFAPKKKVAKEQVCLAECIYYIVTYLYTTDILVMRYWGL